MNRRDALKTEIAKQHGLSLDDLTPHTTFIPAGGGLWCPVISADAEFVTLGDPVERDFAERRANAYGYKCIFLEDSHES